MTVEVGSLSKIVNRVFPARVRSLTESFVYHISMAGSGYTKIDGEDKLWKKMHSYLARGANPDGRSSFGETAIEELCEKSYAATALKLLQEYPNLKVNVARGPTPISPLMYALRDVQPALVKALCEHGADVNALCSSASSSLPPLSAVDFMLGNAAGKEAEALECMKTLLDHGLVPTDNTKRRLFEQKSPLAQLLPDVQQAIDIANALRDKDKAALREMLARGVDPDAGTAFGAPPAIIVAAQVGDVGTIDLLLAQGTSPNAKDKGDTASMPLHQAALHGSRDAFIRLLDAGADPHVVWSDAETGLWSVKGMAAKCTTDPGMAGFVQSVLEARSKADISVEAAHEVKLSRRIRLKPKSPA